MAARSPLPQHPSLTTNSVMNQQLPTLTSNPSSSAAAAANTTTATTAPAPAGSLSRNSSSSGYFPLHQPTPHNPALRANVDEQTYSNTVANSHISSPVAEIPYTANRQPKFTEEWDASVRGSSILEHPISTQQHANMSRSNSISSRPEVLNTAGDSQSTAGGNGTISLSRGNTLKKKASLRRNGSLKRSGSRRSMKAGSVRSLALQSSHDPDEIQSAFFCPVPTSGNPCEILSNRFQTWRKVLKDLITYFREIQSHYEHRSKSLLKLANVLNNVQTPPGFLPSGGLEDALEILRDYHRNAILEANKARDIEEDVILALTGLRSDLGQKMKEIKSLSGDFKNNVDKEMDSTRRAVKALQDILGQSEMDSALTTGKQDPYLLRLAVDRQVERQIDEENYLHQAYLNLESSGRELEAIVVGEIQKSYNAYAGILKREADSSHSAIEELRVGPIAMPKDHEWLAFVQKDPQFVDPELPVRSAEYIQYPGKDHYACQEIRAGLLERKSKYLKSYTAGWYVLSPTHLHEFKSADKQMPVMSLYLPEQKLGSHSTEGGSSNKFILKGRQTGSMHRGHTWVFRAESHDTMMAWYEDIKALTEKSPEERSTFVRGHARTYSRSSQRSVSSDGMVDEEDDEPFVSDANAAAVATPGSRHESLPSRPQPGGRFPSDLQVNSQRGLQVPLSPSSQSSGFLDNTNEYAMRGGNSDGNRSSDYEVIAAAGALPGSGVGDNQPSQASSQHMVGQSYGNTASVIMDTAPSHAQMIHQEAQQDGVNPYSGEPLTAQREPIDHYTAAPIVVSDSSQHVQQDQTRDIDPVSDVTNNPNAPASIVATQHVAATTTEQPQVTANTAPENGYAPGSAGLGYSQTSQIARPSAGRRFDSTPHVPGEYPRGTPTTPAV